MWPSGGSSARSRSEAALPDIYTSSSRPNSRGTPATAGASSDLAGVALQSTSSLALSRSDSRRHVGDSKFPDASPRDAGMYTPGRRSARSGMPPTPTSSRSRHAPRTAALAGEAGPAAFFSPVLARDGDGSARRGSGGSRRGSGAGVRGRYSQSESALHPLNDGGGEPRKPSKLIDAEELMARLRQAERGASVIKARQDGGSSEGKRRESEGRPSGLAVEPRRQSKSGKNKRRVQHMHTPVRVPHTGPGLTGGNGVSGSGMMTASPLHVTTANDARRGSGAAVGSPLNSSPELVRRNSSRRSARGTTPTSASRGPPSRAPPNRPVPSLDGANGGGGGGGGGARKRPPSSSSGRRRRRDVTSAGSERSTTRGDRIGSAASHRSAASQGHSSHSLRSAGYEGKDAEHGGSGRGVGRRSSRRDAGGMQVDRADSGRSASSTPLESPSRGGAVRAVLNNRRMGSLSQSPAAGAQASPAYSVQSSRTPSTIHSSPAMQQWGGGSGGATGSMDDDDDTPPPPIMCTSPDVASPSGGFSSGTDAPEAALLRAQQQTQHGDRRGSTRNGRGAGGGGGIQRSRSRHGAGGGGLHSPAGSVTPSSGALSPGSSTAPPSKPLPKPPSHTSPTRHGSRSGFAVGGVGGLVGDSTGVGPTTSSAVELNLGPRNPEALALGDALTDASSGSQPQSPGVALLQHAFEQTSGSVHMRQEGFYGNNRNKRQPGEGYSTALGFMGSDRKPETGAGGGAAVRGGDGGDAAAGGRPGTRARKGRGALRLHVAPSINDAATPPTHGDPGGFGAGGFGRRPGAGPSMPSRHRAGPRKKPVQLGVSVRDRDSRKGRGSGGREHDHEGKAAPRRDASEPALALPGSSYGRHSGSSGGKEADDGVGGAHYSSEEDEHSQSDVLEPLGASTDASAAGARPGLMVENGWGDTVTSEAPQIRESWDMSANGTLRLPGFGEIKKEGITRITRQGQADDRGMGGGGAGAGSRQVVPLNIRDELVLLEELGRGASGVVRKALHVPTLQLVAVKHVRIFDQAKRHQMVAELQALYQNMVPLNAKKKPSDGRMAPSPHLVEFYDAYTRAQAGIVSIVMEYMSGGSLQELLTHGPLTDEEQLSSIARQVMKGLSFLHKAHQLHRDIKPANILRSFDGTVKLADFGISRELDDSMAKANTFIGTLIYMAPERIESEGYSYAADVWAAGLSLLAIALGKFPYSTGGGYWALSRAIKEEPAPSVPESFSADFRNFVLLTLTKDPAKRPSAAELLKHPFITSHQHAADQRRMHHQAGASPAASAAVRRLQGGKPSSPASSSKLPEGRSEGEGERPMALDEAKRSKALASLRDLVKTVLNNHFKLFRIYFQRTTRRKHILLTKQEWEAEEPMSLQTKLVLSIDDVRVLAAQMGLPALVVRREFNNAISMKFESLRRRGHKVTMSGSITMSPGTVTSGTAASASSFAVSTSQASASHGDVGAAAARAIAQHAQAPAQPGVEGFM